ncbi:MAG: glucosamine-6-phosphate deaminase [Coprobacillus sp.]|nr:glucosamine-6-phosphate deaminase [Coprobacillus sp.]
MEVIICKNKDEASTKACEIMVGIVKENPKAVLGLATGSTPVQLYAKMIEDHKENGTSYKDIQTYNLDEYFGLDQSHPQSYHYFMCHHLFNGLDINMDNVHVPKGKGNVEEEAQKYNEMLAQNPLDIQLLGIGSNGHIGFNEPGTAFDSVTHVVDLKQSTIEDNARLFFDGKIDDVPRQAVSMGIANIMQAKKVLLLAFGEGKAEAVKGMVEGPKTVDLPASALQDHPDCVLIIDEDAAKLLSK